jgi:hypothetical protein
MTRKYGMGLLGVEDRMFRYLMAAENVPTPCSVNGELRAEAEAAVWRLVEKRKQTAVIAEPLPTPPPAVAEPVPAAVPTVEFQAYVELHNRIIRLEAERERLQEPMFAVADAVADIDARLAALERPARVRGPWGPWAWFCDWLQQNGGVQAPAKVQAAPARQEFAATEVYYASAEGGTRR